MLPGKDKFTFSQKPSVPLLSIIVPTLNERENVCELLSRIESSCRDIPHEVIIVDDGSLDGTADVAEHFGSVYGNVLVLRRSKKLGLSSAFMHGVKNSKGEIVALMDADLQHPPELLPELYRKILEGYDLSIASRYVNGGVMENRSLLRKLTSMIGVQLAHLLIPKTRMIKDPISGYFMIKKTYINHMHMFSEGFKVLTSILALGRCKSIAEVPYTFNARKRGRSKFCLYEVINFIKLLLRLNLRTRLKTI